MDFNGELTAQEVAQALEIQEQELISSKIYEANATSANKQRKWAGRVAAAEQEITRLRGLLAVEA